MTDRLADSAGMTAGYGRTRFALRKRRSSSSVGLLRRWTPGPPLWAAQLLGLVGGARLNAKHTAIYISHITSRGQIEQDERVAKGIIDDGESTTGI